MSGLGLRVSGLGFGCWDLGFLVYDLLVRNLGFRVWWLGCRVSGLGFGLGSWYQDQLLRV